MKQKYTRLLAVITAGLMGSMLEISCSTGDLPDEGDHCWFFCQATEKGNTPEVSVTLVQPVLATVVRPA